jgi:hypothetical protein
MNTFFMMGNKRAGTSHLVRLLNLHPELYISNESDIIWILFNFHAGRELAPYPWDGLKNMKYALEKAGYLLDKRKTPAENYFNFQLYFMKIGSPWLKPMKKKNLKWIGDKKPAQYADPSLVAFILQQFPESRFIHLTRHPASHADSWYRRWSAQGRPNLGSYESVIRKQIKLWTFHESRVLELKASRRIPILDLRYEDLCVNPGRELKMIYDFLDLQTPLGVLETAQKETRRNLLDINFEAYSEETLSIMQLYGYERTSLSVSNELSASKNPETF